MRAKHVVTAILIALVLCVGSAVRAGEDQAGRDGSSEIRRPAPRLFSEGAIERYALMERSQPADETVLCGQWSETDATAWIITITVGTAIALALALHGPP